jgi:hypothetical protein
MAREKIKIRQSEIISEGLFCSFCGSPWVHYMNINGCCGEVRPETQYETATDWYSESAVEIVDDIQEEAPEFADPMDSMTQRDFERQQEICAGGVQ